MSVKERRLDLLVDEREQQRRTAELATTAAPARGYRKLYMDHVLQADAGCDFDFLRLPQRPR
jgi:dihydroxy-acid dehydratase